MLARNPAGGCRRTQGGCRSRVGEPERLRIGVDGNTVRQVTQLHSAAAHSPVGTASCVSSCGWAQQPSTSAEASARVASTDGQKEKVALASNNTSTATMRTKIKLMLSS